MDRGRGVPAAEGRCFDSTVFQRSNAGGRERVHAEHGREPSSTVILGESHGLEQLNRSRVVEWRSGRCAGIQPSALASDLGVDVSVVLIGKPRCLLMFKDEEGFRRALSLDECWWSSGGLSMIPWTMSLVLKPLREVWIRCFGLPLHARSARSFMSIGQQWGEVLSIEFGSLDYGVLEEGRICILTDIVPPLNRAFTLLVDGVKFSC
ncbi:hypothetical protein Dimus_002145 [Dionaea muscipula]